MSSLNRILLIGHVGKDVELRLTTTGQPVANFSLATNYHYKKPDGVQVDQTEWHRIVAWNRNAELVRDFGLSKGRQLFVEGRLQSRGWTDPEGVAHTKVEVVAERMLFLGRRPTEAAETSSVAAPAGVSAPEQSSRWAAGRRAKLVLAPAVSPSPEQQL